jgi:hypothetical protein
MCTDDIEYIKKVIIDNDIKLLRIDSKDNLQALIISSSTNTLDFAELLILSFDMIKNNLGYIKIKELIEYINNSWKQPASSLIENPKLVKETTILITNTKFTYNEGLCPNFYYPMTLKNLQKHNEDFTLKKVNEQEYYIEQLLLESEE